MHTNEKSIKHRIGYSALLLGAGLFFLVPASAGAATISLVPSSASVSVGSTVTVSVFVDSEGTAINNAEGNLSFLRNLFDVVSINKDASLFTLWIAAPAYDGNSTISFNGGLPSPGYQGSNGKLFSVILRAKAAGSAALTLVNGAVRANDGLGTDVLSGVRGTTMTITQPAVPSSTSSPAPATSAPDSSSTDLLARITSSTHPDQTKWYNLTHVVFDWTNAQGVTAVRLGYDQDAGGSPHVLYADPISHKEIDIGDGIWYFHVQERGPSGWGSVSTFRIQIDTVPPLPMTIKFPNGVTTMADTIAVSFGTSDALSGIDHYDLSGDGVHSVASAEEGAGVYAFPSEDAGDHTLIATAYDKAGNTARAEGRFTTIGAPSAPPFSLFAWLTASYLALGLLVVAALFLLVVVGWYLWHRFHSFRRRYPGTMEHTHRVLREQFDELTNAVVDEVMTLEKARTKRELTREEERVIANLKKLIKKTEFYVENTVEHPQIRHSVEGRSNKESRNV
ncbi:MAG: cohesin domain-containing protein [bacterium]|nr:cohesin domain-containing protein [bacterium]